MKTFHLHLVSDSTGETIHTLARACVAQFEKIQAIEHAWSMIRGKPQLEKALVGVEANPGIVLFTLVDVTLRQTLVEGCRALGVPSISALDPVLAALSSHLGEKAQGLPGRQHELGAEYFARIEAMNYVLAHDDGQSNWDLDQADIIIVGVSRTSKTPTCIYLANRGVKAANVPFVPGCPLPPNLTTMNKALIVGLTKDANQLIQIRRNRLHMLNETEDSQYTDPQAVKEEIAAARRLYSQHGWPVIDVTRRSIEETAAAIMNLYQERKEPARKT
ncbi:MAG: kinase/pyrophosphorylase [Rhodospirillaceae bacterium]|nr:kinase/pyrophosphorylase [Rhodospirillaceae bacterium]